MGKDTGDKGKKDKDGQQSEGARVAGLLNVGALHEAVAAAAPIEGVHAYRPGQTPPAGGHVVTRPDGWKVQIDYLPAATALQIAAGDAAALAFALMARRYRTLAELRGDCKAWLDAPATQALKLGRAQDALAHVLAWAIRQGMPIPPSVGFPAPDEPDA